MRTSRRKFLGGAAALSVGAVLAAWALQTRDRFRPWARGWYRHVAHPDVVAGAAGELSESTVQALLAASATAIGFEVDMAKYAALFRWRAAHLPGYRDLYEEFALRANSAAQRRGGATFAAVPADRRQAVLADVFGTARSPRSRLERVVAGTFQRHRLRLRDRTVGEALLLFARTDALVQLGYDGWPGAARGLEAYTQGLPGHLEPRR